MTAHQNNQDDTSAPVRGLPGFSRAKAEDYLGLPRGEIARIEKDPDLIGPSCTKYGRRTRYMDVDLDLWKWEYEIGADDERGDVIWSLYNTLLDSDDA